MGLVTVTSIWSMGKTPLSTPTTMRGKFGLREDRHRDGERQVDAHGDQVRMTKMMGLPWRAVQCGASGRP
jgi:hypothetical protein